jgi:hypothetical protein
MGIQHPEELNDDVFNKLLFEYNFMRNYDRKFYLSIAKQAISDILIGTQGNE